MQVRTLVSLTVIAALTACASPYKILGVEYPSPADALAAQEKRLDNVLNSIERRSQPSAGHARVVIPSKQAILERGVKPAGSAEVRHYLASFFYNNVQFVTRAIKKRNLFEKVDVEETAAPDFLQPTPGVITIYRYVSSDRNAGWYYASEATPQARVNMDTRQRDFAGLYRSLLDSIEALVEKEKEN